MSWIPTETFYPTPLFSGTNSTTFSGSEFGPKWKMYHTISWVEGSHVLFIENTREKTWKQLEPSFCSVPMFDQNTWKQETLFWLKHEPINQNCTNQINQTTVVDGIPIRMSPVCRVLTHSLHGSQHCNLTTIDSSSSDRNPDSFTIAKYLLSILFGKTFNAFAQVLRLHLPRT